MRTLAKTVIVSILTTLAKGVLAKYKPTIIAVTGSVGKTSTKDAVYAVLASRHTVWKSQKSFNSDVGVPLTILDCKNGWNNLLVWIFNICKGVSLLLFPYTYPKFLVLEVGADKPGDLRSLMSWLSPDTVVVTRLPKISVHVENYDNNPEAVIEEESLPATLLKPGGTLVLNYDDDTVAALGDVPDRTVISYGFLPQAMVGGSEEGIAEDSAGVPKGMRMMVAHNGESVQVFLPGVIGMHMLYPVLAGAAVGSVYGVSLTELPLIVKHHTTPPGRMRLLSGIKNTIIIDDTYNASPVAAKEALYALKEVKAVRKIATLADMKELGSFTDTEHYEIGKVAAEVVDVLVSVGVAARRIAEGALDNGLSEKNVFQFDNALEAGKFLDTSIAQGDVVLVKGSQSMRMEKAVLEIMGEPQLAESLLVRQDEEWRRR